LETSHKQPDGSGEIAAPVHPGAITEALSTFRHASDAYL